MSAPKASPASAGSGKKKSGFERVMPWVLLFAIAYWLWGMFTPNVHTWKWRAERVENTAKQKIIDRQEAKREVMKATADLDEMVELKHAIDTERKYYENAIQTLPQRCPATDGWLGKDEKLLDLTGCKDGTSFKLVLKDPFKEETYEAYLFTYGRDKDGKVDKNRLVPVGEAPEIAPFEGSSNKAEKLSPNGAIHPVEYKLYARVKFIYKGNADALKLVKK